MAPGSWFSLAGDRFPELWMRTGEHIMLTGVSTGAAVLLGVPLGVLAQRCARLRGILMGLIGIVQTIPSLAMLAFLLALIHRIGAVPALIALTLYALLPIVRNTVAGIEGVSAEILEAASGIGMTRWQDFWRVRLPLALPVIVAGVRTAAVVGVGIATLSAFIGAGGLGEFINRGLALSNTDLILLGAVPAALLALLVDFSIGAAAWALERRAWRRRGRVVAGFVRTLALLLPLGLAGAGLAAYAYQPANGPPAETIRIGAKNFTEQFVLRELMAHLIEERTEVAVERVDLGGTMLCHEALVEGEIDIYAEYTGTGLTVILKRPPIADREAVYRQVAREYRERFALRWLEPFGFNNTYAIAVRRAEAERNGWQDVSDLRSAAADVRAGFTSEFMERPDGYLSFQERYGFRFGTVRDLEPSLMYRAVAKGEVDVISAFATSGQIAAFDLRTLRDDRRFFPPYDAAPVARIETLEAHPELARAIAPLAGLLDAETMRRLNFEVEEEKREPADVARAFLRSRGLVK